MCRTRRLGRRCEELRLRLRIDREVVDLHRVSGIVKDEAVDLVSGVGVEFDVDTATARAGAQHLREGLAESLRHRHERCSGEHQDAEEGK